MVYHSAPIPNPRRLRGLREEAEWESLIRNFWGLVNRHASFFQPHFGRHIALGEAALLRALRGRFLQARPVQWLMVNASSRRVGIPGGTRGFKSIYHNVEFNALSCTIYALSMHYLCTFHPPSAPPPPPLPSPPPSPPPSPTPLP